MKAAILQDGRITVGELPDPTPGPGQVLVRTRRCGLCASDAHFLCSGHTVVEKSREFGMPYGSVDMTKPIVMGHEFVGEIIDYGPGTQRLIKPGRRVTASPIGLMGPDKSQVAIVGYQNEFPGGFGELMVLEEPFLLEVPDDIDDEVAAIIEALAVGVEHAHVGNPQPGDVPLVVGCGAIGLAVIASLKLRNIAPIVATDLDPGRRALALKLGADAVFDPRELPAYGPMSEIGGRTPNLIYECVGKQGIMNDIVTKAADGATIVIGGFCLDPEHIYVPVAQMKALTIKFARGDGPEEMKIALDAIARGKVDLQPLLGGTIGLGEVEKSLLAMSDPSTPVRVVVDPSRM